jgi:hypothetical protein
VGALELQAHGARRFGGLEEKARGARVADAGADARVAGALQREAMRLVTSVR